MSEPFAFVFPGQGSQAVGMGVEIYHASPAARSVFDVADRAVDFPLSRLCFEGPEDALRETINTQPAIVATSLALLAALQAAAAGDAQSDDPTLADPLQPIFVAGHSVGEYSALAASGALGIEDTLRLVRERGRVMHEAGVACPSGMAVVLGLDAATLTEVCAEATAQARAELAADEEARPGAGRVVVANDNAPGQIVISGARRALELAMALAKARGAKRVVPLAVSGAFHSPVMAPAAQPLAAAVEAAPIRDAAIPLISNITAQPLTLAADVRSELSRQIEAPVQWTRTVAYLADRGVRTIVEIGAGQVLAGLVKRIARNVAVLSIAGPMDIDPVLAQLRSGTRDT